MLKEAFKDQGSTVLGIYLATVALICSVLPDFGNRTAVLMILAFAHMFLVPYAMNFFTDRSNTRDYQELYLLSCLSALVLLLLVGSMNYDIIELLPWVSIACCGVPIIFGSVKAVVFERDITADVLVSLAIIASCIIGDLQAGAVVAIIMQIGSFLEEATVSHANRQIAHLHGLKPFSVVILRNGHEIRVLYEEVCVGDIVRVRPGETVPVDGVVVSGNSSIDTSSLTGESVPVDISVGSSVMSGTQNLFGSFDMEVKSVGSDSTLERMSKLIDEADAGKSRIVRAADRWARVIVVVALSIAAVAYVLTGDITRSVAVLVVFCPCALILATPTAIMAAAGNMSRHGILLKDGGAVERLAKIDTVLFDKTGTLTTGVMECCGFKSYASDISDEKLAQYACAVEAHSEHPLGKAISEFGGSDVPAEDFTYVPGRGVIGKVEGKTVYAGNRQFVMEYCPEGFDKISKAADQAEQDGYMAVLIGADSRSLGIALLSDTVKDNSAYAVRHFWMLGMKRVLITGDSRERATRMRDSLKMDDVVWECLPDDKLDIVSKIDGNGTSCMIGDGVNDAPSLRRAGVGIAMGGVGSDMAIESSDIVLMDDDLSKLPPLVRLCRRTIKTIHLGIAFSLTLNLAATVLAVMGILSPVAGALVHNIGSVAVIIAASMILRFNPWRRGVHKARASGSASKH